VIVVDTNVVAYLLEGHATAAAARLRDPEWAAPLLWRSEYRNVLAGDIRRRQLAVGAALESFLAAELLVADREYQADAARVLRLVAGSRCSAYDCEFVAVAQALGVPLVTADRRLAAEFPETAITLDDFTA
jgi:predicted nucleic acid-binding protein